MSFVHLPKKKCWVNMATIATVVEKDGKFFVAAEGRDTVLVLDAKEDFAILLAALKRCTMPATVANPAEVNAELLAACEEVLSVAEKLLADADKLSNAGSATAACATMFLARVRPAIAKARGEKGVAP
jgi:hypothetical protein